MFFGKKEARPQEPDKQDVATASVPEAPEKELEVDVPAAGGHETAAANTLAQIRQALDAASSAAPKPKKAVPTEARTEEEKERWGDRSLYKSLLAGLYDAILILDRRGATIGSNGRAESFFGYDQAELWNKPCTEMISAITPRILTKIQMHAENGRFTVVSAACTRKDGSTFPAEIAISKIDLLNEGDLILSVRNQERRAKANEARKLEQAALTSAGAGIVVCRTDGMIEMINPATTKLLQLESSADACQRFIGDFCTSHEAASALMRTPSAQGNWLGEMEIVTGKGIVRKVLATAALSDEKKQRKHIVVTLTPIPVKLSSVAADSPISSH